MTEIHRLENGITLICEPVEGLRSVSLGVWIGSGSADEDSKNNGIAHFTEHMLFKGTKTRTAREIADFSSRIGGHLNAFTAKEATAYYARTLDVHLYDTLALFADMIQNPLLSEKDIAREKMVVLEEIDMYDDSPEDIVHEMLQMEVFKDHPLGYQISGTRENVSRFTETDVRQFMNRHYTGGNIIISAAGQVEPEAFKQAAAAGFGTLKASPAKTKAAAPVYHTGSYKKEKDIQQVHISIAFPGIPAADPESYPAAAANLILGGSVGSRLFQNIREEKGYVYSIESYLCAFQSTGLLQIYGAAPAGKKDLFLEDVMAEIRRIKRDGITGDELFYAREEMKTELLLSLESTRSRMEYNVKSMQHFGRIVPVEETLQQMEAVTREDVHAFFERCLNLDQAAYAFAGSIEE